MCLWPNFQENVSTKTFTSDVSSKENQPWYDQECERSQANFYTCLNDYKKDKLITKQQLTIEDYKESLIEIKKSSQHIRYKFINIGGPLNDNVLQFNQEQLKFINKIAKLVEDIEYLAEDMTNENE